MFRGTRPVVLIVVDALVAALWLYLFYFLRYADPDHLPAEFLRYLPHAALFAFALLVAVAACGGYEIPVIRRGSTIAARLLLAGFLALVPLALTGFLFRELLVWRSGVMPALATSLVCFWIGRQLLVRMVDLGPVARRVFAIGDEPFLTRLREAAVESGDFVVVDSRALDQVRQLGPAEAEAFAATLEGQRIADLVVAARERRGRLPLHLLLAVRMRGIRVVAYEDLYEQATGRVDLDAVRPSWFVFVDGFEGSRLDHFGKRLFDLVVASVVLALTAPLMALAALAIKLEDGGPIFYSQIRIGRCGVPFRLYKFRTMRPDAERDGPRFADARDPRTTRVGRVLRRFRIDELPQLIHVLTGEMSFVGPRPERPEFVQRFRELVPWFEQRHRIKPGLAGWAQLNAPYAADLATTRLKLAYDLYYLRHWSLAFDLAILLRTFQVVVWGQGAR